VNTVNSTVRPAGRRVVRRKQPALEDAWDAALSELPPEIRPLVQQYAENVRQGQEIRSELSTVLTRNRMRWRDVDQAILPLMHCPR
jgi:hypothetical protein